MTTKAELRKHYAKCHYSIGGEPVIESRTGNPNIEPEEGGIYNHNPLQKELSDELLIAQYLGKQQFSMPDSEHNELVIKPDLDHLITSQQRPAHQQLALKPEPIHDQQGLQREQLIRNQGLARDQLIRNGQELNDRDQLGMRIEHTLSRDQLMRGGEQLIMRNDHGMQRSQITMRTNDELNRHQQLPQQTHHIVPKHELEPSQGAVLLSRSHGGTYNSSIDKYSSSNSHLMSSNQQFWTQGPPLANVSSANGVQVQQGTEVHQPVQIHPVKLKQNL